MESSLPKAILFDWDGTLTDSWQTMTRCMNATFREFGGPQWTTTEFRKNATRSLRDNFPLWFGARWEQARDFFYSTFRTTHTEGLEPLPGVVAGLEWLHTQKIHLAVISNKQGDFLRTEAAFLELKRFFACITGAGDAPRDKPDPIVVTQTLEGTGIDPGPNVWFVGDSETDMECAHNSGCLAVHLLFGQAPLSTYHSTTKVYADFLEMMENLKKSC